MLFIKTLMLLLLSATLSNAQRDRFQHQPNLINVTYSSSRPTTDETLNQTQNATGDSLETSPSITSLHQVWTSSSSGRLDELSPEMISKLRNDVPFLAAYALRPRLVGAAASSSGAASSQSHDPRSLTLMGPSGTLPSLDVGASSPQAARLPTGSESLIPKLGDFSEFKVETSSLSKSEHHHKRKTSLKRQRDGNPTASASSSSRRRRVTSDATQGEDSLGQLMRKMRQRQAANKRKSTSRRRPGSGRRSRRSRFKLNKRQKSKKLKRKNSRLLQDDTKMSSENDLDVKGGKPEGEVKGGPAGPRKPSFFAAAQPKSEPAAEKEPTDDQPAGVNEDDIEIDEGPEAEPKRVGDDDVEEDGDTIFVEPKSDGVDDDPPLPEDDSNAVDSNQNNVGEEDDALEKEEPTSRTSPLVPEGDPRGNRVNRQKPNVEIPPTIQGEDVGIDDDDENESGSAGNRQAAGAGIGATTGAGGPGSGIGGSGAGRTENGDGSLDDVDSPGGARGFGVREDGQGAGASVSPGVEFADDKGNMDDKKSSSGGSSDGHGDGGFGERRKGDKDRTSGGGSIGSAARDDGRDLSSHDEDDVDLDYRDEMAQEERKDTGAKDSSKGHTNRPLSPSTGVNSTAHQQHAKGDHCDDGSYNHHHHGDHHNHQDTIDWLRGAISGEPDENYPILSRVNSTDFRCSDQKHAGYYADVDSRCQIFHICQMDGRQDSFLCANGTIFSQRSLVCVWWNGFNCEDAPKYYHLNELLYKTTSGDESPQAAALPNLRPHLGPRGGDVASAAPDENDSPIDGLVREMRGGRKESTMTTSSIGGSTGSGLNSDGAENGRAAPANGGGVTTPMRGNNFGPDDEATIQRKSTNLDYNPAEEQPPARLRTSRENVPRRRRRRRASTRQAPPKLKSRRVSRNSRRRKLRHGIKPRRRA